MALTDLQTVLIIRNPATVEELIAATCDTIAKEFGWDTNSYKTAVICRYDPSMSVRVYVTDGSTRYLNLVTSSEGTDGAVVETDWYQYRPEFKTTNTYYLNYYKSSSGKTIAFNVYTSTFNTMQQVIAVDSNSRASCIMFLPGVTGRPAYLYNGRCMLFNTVPSINNTIFYRFVRVSTAFCATALLKLPNILGGAMFNELYMVASCPLSDITGAVFSMSGTYVGISNTTCFAIKVS